MNWNLWLWLILGVICLESIVAAIQTMQVLRKFWRYHCDGFKRRFRVLPCPRRKMPWSQEKRIPVFHARDNGLQKTAGGVTMARTEKFNHAYIRYRKIFPVWIAYRLAVFAL